MTYPELLLLFKPGMVARRRTWERDYTLQLVAGDVVRLQKRLVPVKSFNPAWRERGYDAHADDYEFLYYKCTPETRVGIEATEEEIAAWAIEIGFSYMSRELWRILEGLTPRSKPLHKRDRRKPKE